jgi:hypothetical protein
MIAAFLLPVDVKDALLLLKLFFIKPDFKGDLDRDLEVFEN